MGIVLVLITLGLFSKRTAKLDLRSKQIIYLGLLGLVAFSFILNEYMETAYQWENGVAGADLLAHFEGAKALMNGTPLTKLYTINYRFALQFSNLGYLLYAFLLSVVSFFPVIISERFSLQFMYIIQCIVAVWGILNISDFFSDFNLSFSKKSVLNSQKKRVSIELILLSCVCIAQSASVLMRDIWIFYLVSLLMYECRPSGHARKSICFFLIVLAAVFRLYTLIITLPIFVGYGLKRKKLAAFSTMGGCLLFFIGQTVIQRLAVFMNILWQYDFTFNLQNMIEFLLFPNILTQTAAIQNMATGYHVLFGGNCEWVYYLLACWNVFAMPIVAYGGFQCIRQKKWDDLFLWGFMLLAVCLLYAVFYDNVSEPRHKLMLIYSYSFFFSEGITKMKKKAKVIYMILFLLVIIGIFAIV